MKKLIAIILAAALIISIVGCKKAEKPSLPQETIKPTVTQGEQKELPPKKLPQLTIVFAGKTDEAMLNDSVKEGIQKLKTEFEIEANELQCNNDKTKYQSELETAAKQSEIVVVVGTELYAALSNVARSNPDIKFIVANADGANIEVAENISCISYANDQSAFLAGFIAARYSSTNIVGIVCMANTPEANKYVEGFSGGAQYAKESIDVKTAYINTSEGAASGKECAGTLCDMGCDVIYSVAGAEDFSVFEAVTENSIYAIAADYDKKYINPEIIICSSVKNVGEAVYVAVADYINDGSFAGGTTEIADLSRGLVGISYGDEAMHQQLSEELKAEVEEIALLIASGEIGM